MTITYLKPHDYYEDLYDKLTVEHCRDLAAYDTSVGLTEADFEKAGMSQEEIKELGTKVIQSQWLDLVVEMSVFMYAAERYNNKEERIAEWMHSDKARDDLLTGSEPPRRAVCRECLSTDLRVISKDLYWHDDKQDRVLFMFRCDKCSVNSAYFNNGEKWEITATLCPICKRDRHSHTKKEEGGVLTFTYTCQLCDNIWTETLDLRPAKKEEPDLNYHEDRKLYCYSEKVQAWAEDIKRMGPLLKQFPDEEERKKRELLKQQLDSIERLTVAQLSERLSKLLKKNGYTDFQLGAPNTDRELVVPFTAIDSKSDRMADQSRSGVWKLVTKDLGQTNWRLVRSSLSYRLGYIQGKLKGYEGDFELEKLLGKKQPKG